MYPTIPLESYVTASKIWFSSIKKNDIVVFEPIDGISSVDWVHRVTTDAGQTISVCRDQGRIDALEDRSSKPYQQCPLSTTIPKGFIYQADDSENTYHGIIPFLFLKAKVILHLKLPW